MALAGLAVLAGTDGGAGGTAAGDLLVAGGVLSASLYTIVAKRFGDDSDPLSLTTWQFTVAAVATGGTMTARWATGAGTAARVGSAPVLAGRGARRRRRFGVSFLLFNTVIVRVNAARAAVVLNLIPVFGVTGAIVFLGERVTRRRCPRRRPRRLLGGLLHGRRSSRAPPGPYPPDRASPPPDDGRLQTDRPASTAAASAVTARARLMVAKLCTGC